MAVATKVPTVQWSNQLLVLSLAVSIDILSYHISDNLRAYTQSTTSLERKMYIRPVDEKCTSTGKVLKVVESLYGIAESEPREYFTYMRLHIGKLVHPDHDRTHVYYKNMVKMDWMSWSLYKSIAVHVRHAGLCGRRGFRVTTIFIQADATREQEPVLVQWAWDIM